MTINIFIYIIHTDEHENLIQRLSEQADGDLDAGGSLTTTTNDHHHHHQQLIDSLTQHQHQQHIRNNNNHHKNKRSASSSEISPTKSDSSKEENNNLKPGSSNSLMAEHSPLSPDMKRRRFDDTESPVPSDVSFYFISLFVSLGMANGRYLKVGLRLSCGNVEKISSENNLPWIKPEFYC